MKAKKKLLIISTLHGASLLSIITGLIIWLWVGIGIKIAGIGIAASILVEVCGKHFLKRHPELIKHHSKSLLQFKIERFARKHNIKIKGQDNFPEWTRQVRSLIRSGQYSGIILDEQLKSDFIDGLDIYQAANNFLNKYTTNHFQ